MPRQARLKQAATKIPEDWDKKITEIAERRGITRAEFIRETIGQRLGLIPDTPVTPDPIQDISRAEFEALAARVAALERIPRLSKPATPRPRPDRSQDAPSIEASTALDHKRADGKRWLTTQQAWDVAKDRGCDRSFNGFRGWSKRNPEDCLRLFGLRYIEHGSKSNTVASFEDVRFSE